MLISNPLELSKLNKILYKIEFSSAFSEENKTFYLKIIQPEWSQVRNTEFKRRLFFYEYKLEVPYYSKYELAFSNVITYKLDEEYENPGNNACVALGDLYFKEIKFDEKNKIITISALPPTSSDRIEYILCVAEFRAMFYKKNPDFHFIKTWPFPQTFFITCYFSIGKPILQRIIKKLTRNTAKKDQLLSNIT